MIEQAIAMFPNVIAVTADRFDLMDEPEAPRIVITVQRAGIRGPDRWLLRHQWGEWTWATFRPQVYATIGLEVTYPDERNAR